MSESGNRPTEDIQMSPRLPMHAILLSMLMTGLGQIYCGELITGLAWSAIGSFAGVISLWGLATGELGLMGSSMPMWIVGIVAAFDAWRRARNAPTSYQLKLFNDWRVYSLLALISTLGAAGYGFLIRSNVVMAYVTPVEDMLPTLQRGDRFLVDKTAYRHELASVGDVVVFKNPAKPTVTWVKRIVATANETVEIRDRQLLINGKPTDFPKNTAGTVEDYGPIVVPPYSFFVLGDNHANSRDSRHFGPISHAGVEGKATRVYWPPSAWFERSSIK